MRVYIYIYIYIYTHRHFLTNVNRFPRHFQDFSYLFVLFGFIVSLRATSFCPLAPKTEKVIKNTLPKDRHVVFCPLQGIPIFYHFFIKKSILGAL